MHPIHPGVAFHAAFVLFACLTSSSIAAAQAGTVVAVSGFGAIPGDGIDDTAAIQTALNALLPGEILLFDQPGNYDLTRAPATWPGAPAPLGSTAPLLTLTGKSDITITAVAGARIRLTGYDRSVTTARYPNVLKVENCPNFSLLGAGPKDPLVFDMKPATNPNPTNEGLPFVQGKLIALNAQLRIATIRMSDPELFLPLSCTPAVWGAWEVVDSQPGVNADWIRGTVQAITTPNAPTQDVELRFNSASWVLPHASWTLNHDIVALINDSETYCVVAWNCAGATVVKDLVAHHLPGKFVQIGNCDDLLVENVDVYPRRDSSLLSIARDGVNASAEHLSVRDCNLSFCGDDGIVANGTSYGEVFTYNTTANTFRVRPPTAINKSPSYASVGQHLVLVDRQSMNASPYELAEISAISWIQTYPTAPYTIIEYTYINETPGFETLLATTNPYTYNPWYSLFGAEVNNCTVESDRGVGITVRSINTRITSCAVSKASVLGIHAGGGMVGQYPWWGAGAPPHNLVIEYSEIDSCGGLSPLPLTGSIHIEVARGELPYSGPCTYFVNPVLPTSTQAIIDVTLNGNVIRNSRRAGVYAANVGGAAGIQINGNWFIDCGEPNTCHPEYDCAVVAELCGSGQIRSNQFINCANKVTKINSPNVVVIP